MMQSVAPVKSRIDLGFLKDNFHKVARIMPTMAEFAHAETVKLQRMEDQARRIVEQQALQILSMIFWGAAAANSSPGPRNLEGDPVLLMSGYRTNDVAMEKLQEVLEDHGYRVFMLNFGLNEGPSEAYHVHVEDRIAQIIEVTGKKPALAGHSWGGITAVAAAAALPGQVASVITMGSPFIHQDHMIGVPITSIYSRNDGVVLDWKNCKLPFRRNFTNIEVEALHSGFPTNHNTQQAVISALQAMSDMGGPRPRHRGRRPDLVAA